MSNTTTTPATPTYFAEEISIEERDAALAEAAELALADYHAHLDDPHYDEPEDRYLDSQWEDFNEYGMEGCCGDF